MWILVALRDGPSSVARLLDTVRALDGQVGPGTFYGAVARLERLRLIEGTTNGNGGQAYRLPQLRDERADAARGGAVT
jgi:DNA-binding PadR family transcriptional regulator